MKVLLISANRVLAPYPVYPLGLDYVAGAISQSHQVQRLDINCHADNNETARRIARLAPDIVGISLRNIDNTDALHPESYIPAYQDLITAVRRACEAPIVLGGSGFTLFPHALMTLLEADYGIIGPGEQMAPFLAALAQGESVSDIPGVITRTTVSDRTIYRTTQSAGISPCPPENIDFYMKNGGILNLQTKRGCPFRCVYCSYPRLEGGKMHYRSPADIARDALTRQRAGAKYLFITDSVFNAHPQQSLDVARAFKQAGLTIPWGGYFTPAAMPAGYYDTLAQCGLTHVEFGTESLCDSVLAAYGKPFNVADVFACHRDAVAAGLHVAHFFLFAGPGEDEKTVAASLDNMKRLEKTVLFAFCGMRIYPGTPLYDIALEQEQINPSDPLLKPVYFQSPGITISRAADLIEAHADGRDNWISRAKDDQTVDILPRMYSKGFSGPLWEYLIR